MVGAFFYCHNNSMDMKKLFKKLLETEDIKNIPLEHVIKVFAAIFEIINSGECFFENN